MPSIIDLFVIIAVGGLFIASVPFVSTCSFDLKDVCENVTCPEGISCQIDTSYYCEGRFGNICSPVATCTYDQDPCKNFSCPVGSVCVNVTDTCDQNSFCTMKAQCNARVRDGTCPDPKNLPIHSCQNSCTDSDHFCPKDMKCCYSAFALGNYCVATWNISSVGISADTTSLEATDLEEDQDDPRTAASRILHPWNRAPKSDINPVVPDNLDR